MFWVEMFLKCYFIVNPQAQFKNVLNYKYLGVLIDEHLSFACNAEALAGAAGRALGLIRFKLRFLKECRSATFTKMFESYVSPITDYGAGVWGTKSFECIEQVQRRAARYFLGVHRFAATDMVLGDIGWVTCLTRHKFNILSLYNRLVLMNPDIVKYSYGV